MLKATTALRITGPGGSGFAVSRIGPIVHVALGVSTTHPPLPSMALGVKGPDAGNDYPYRSLAQNARLDPWGEPVREDTSWVAWALHSRNHYEMLSLRMRRIGPRRR